MKLLEKDLTLDEALEVFDISEVPDERTLKQLYAKLSKENHPDRGGDTDTMILINNAYEVLSRVKPGTVSAEQTFQNMKKREAEQKIKNKIQHEYMEEMFDRTFDVDELIDYVSQFSEDEFGSEIKIQPYSERSYSSSFVSEVEVFNEDRSLVYYVMFYISPNDSNQGGLGYDGLDMDEYMYDFTISTDIFYNNRKQKLSQSNYQWRKGKKVLVDYEEIFPSAKVKKLFTSGGKKSFRKADFILGLERGIPATIHEERGTYFVYPFKESKDIYFSITRLTLLKVASYTIQNMRGWKNGYKQQLFRIPGYKSLYETEEVMTKMITAFRESVSLIRDQGINLNSKDDSDPIFEIFLLAFKAYDLI